MRSSKWVPLVLGLVVLFIIIGIAVFYLHVRETNLTSPQLQKVTIAQAADVFLYLPLYIAQDQGFFRAQGLNVTIVTAGGDAQAFAAVVSGNAQFAQGDPTFAAISSENGYSGKVVFSVINKAPFYMLSLTNQSYQSAASFKGKTIATYPDPNTAYAMTLYLANQSGLTVGKDYQIDQVQFGTELGPLFNHQVNATVTLIPTVQEAEQQGAYVVYSYPDQFGNISVTGLTTTSAMITNDPQLVQKVVNAYAEAMQYIYTNPNGSLAVASENFPSVPANVLQGAIQQMTSDQVWPETGFTSQEAWNNAIYIRQYIGEINATPPFADVVDNNFVNMTLNQT